MRRVVIITAKFSVAIVMIATLCAAGLVVYARSQGLHILSVQTGSMRPAIRPGDAVLVRIAPQPATTADFRKGQIITYTSDQNPEATITHRIVDIDRTHGRLITQGDALGAPDVPVVPGQVVGVSTRTVPLLGGTLNLVRQPLGLGLAVYLPAAILIIVEIRRLMKYYAAQRYVVYYY